MSAGVDRYRSRLNTRRNLRATSPHPDRLQTPLDKFGGFDDAVRLDHALRFLRLRLRGGDVNGDFAGVPASQLAVLPGSTHFFGLARSAFALDVVLPFLDAEMSSR